MPRQRTLWSAEEDSESLSSLGRDGALRDERKLIEQVLMLRGLELTQEQKTQLKAIRESHRPAFQADFQAMRKAKTDLFDYLKKGGNDSGQIATLIGASVDAQKSLETDGANVFLEAYKVLSPEQQKKLSEQSLEGWEGRRHHWGRKHRAEGDETPGSPSPS